MRLPVASSTLGLTGGLLGFAAALAVTWLAPRVEARPPPGEADAVPPLRMGRDGGPRCRGRSCLGADAKKVEVSAEAEKLLGAAANAFKAEDAGSLTALIQDSKEARLYLRLKGVKEGGYTKAQATEILEKQYFAKRSILTLSASEECSGCGEWSVSRSYRLVYRLGEKDKDVDGSLVIGIRKQQVTGDVYGWFLNSLADG